MSKTEPKVLSRRNFIKGAAVTGATAAGVASLMGCSSNEGTSEDSEIKNSAYPWEKTADVVVVGAGTSLLAALKAADAGANVLILEKHDVPGGDTKISGGVIYCGGNTETQKKAGVIDERTGEPDTMESFISDWMRHAGANTGVNETLMTKVLESGPDLLQWFADKGITWRVYKSGSDPVQRGHVPEADPSEGSLIGHYITDVLIDELNAAGAEIIVDTAVDDIIVDPITQEILGVRAKTGTGEVKYYGSKALIIGCGGTGSNTDLTMQYNPEAIKWLSNGLPTSMGDGFLMTEKLNVARIGQGSWLDPENPHPVLVAVYSSPGTHRIQEPMIINRVRYALSGPRALIFTDYAGSRYTDETKGYPFGIGRDLAGLHGGFCWSITDKTYWEVEVIQNYLKGCDMNFDKLITEGILVEAATVEDLASVTGIDVGTLQNTLQRWNDAVAAGNDSDFNRPVESMQAIEAPYYAYKLIPAAPVPQVGASLSLNINEKCEVLDLNGHTVPGLYAVGTGMTMSPTMGRGYPGSGTNLMAGFGCALIAGPEAAAFALR